MENDQKPLTIQSKKDFWKAEEVQKRKIKTKEKTETTSKQHDQINSHKLRASRLREMNEMK